MNSHSVDFSGETVLVIAATGGIGSVMATARQLEGPLAEVVERIRAAGGSEPRHWPWT
jgi:NADPH:quinone reductase-like Zn-dependent oxidoreductase